ncbi:MAG: pyridoxal-dependent decarboxylase [Cyclobacteriaceae bacterium]|nr:pyridoxal-dependent decarboxylase [Cyclobacteriaceae bacterium]
MDNKSFRKEAHKMVDWMADYLENIEQYPVKSGVSPCEIYDQIDKNPPQQGEQMNDIFSDFNEKIMPGITHWQHPNFHAYFTGNSSYPSVLAEMLTATIGAQCMIWDTSPAAAELEEKVMEWLQQMLGLPLDWTGCIQDTASTATLSAILSAREKFTHYTINQQGFTDQPQFRVYCSKETHSSIDKAVKIAGIGVENLTKIDVDDSMAMLPDTLEKTILKDIEKGLKPLCVIATLGTTGTTAIDPINEIAAICAKHSVWLHIDAAFAGTALVLPQYRWMIKGIENADSFVFNPHKWMFTNFDCSAYFVKDKKALTRTFEILPEYLKTKVDLQVNNYRDWGIPLGRRFRALKLWFVIRSYGVEGVKQRVQEHIEMAQALGKKMDAHTDFEQLSPLNFNMICFRYHPKGYNDEEKLNSLNEILINTLNDSGKVYMTHTKIRGKYTIRMVIGQTYVQQRHVDMAWNLIQETAKNIDHEN